MKDFCCSEDECERETFIKIDWKMSRWQKEFSTFSPEKHQGPDCGTVFKGAFHDLHKQTRPAVRRLNISVNLLLFLMTVIGSDSDLSWLDESQN